MKARKEKRINGPQAQASWYVARLYSGEMTGKDEDDLSCWLEADPAHRRAYSETLAIWDAVGELGTDPELVASSGMQATFRNAWRKPNAWIAAAAIVAVVALSVVSATFLERSGDGRALTSYETTVGEQRMVTLNDGSRLTLNTASRVLVDYGPNERRIILDFGEVFFEIEKDPRWPLTVSARGRLVAVLGTKFSVLIAGNDIRIAVIEGAVAVSKEDTRFPLNKRQTLRPSGESSTVAPSGLTEWVGTNDVILRAGTMATFGNGYEPVVKQDTDVIEELQSWREGVVRFNAEPLFRVVAELNRYSQAKILIEDDAIVNLPISGVFMLERVDLILIALEDVIPITVIRHSDRYVLVGSNPGMEPASQTPMEPPAAANR